MIMCVIVVALFALMIFLARLSEKKDWNHGICKICGAKLKYFDSCFCGDRGYKCPNCNNTIWISYHVDK